MYVCMYHGYEVISSLASHEYMYCVHEIARAWHHTYMYCVHAVMCMYICILCMRSYVCIYIIVCIRSCVCIHV